MGYALFSLAKCLRKQNRIDEAKECYLREIEIVEKNEGLESDSLILSYRSLGIMLRNADRLEEAESFLEKALDLAEKNQATTGEEIDAELHSLGQLRLLQARYQESEELFLRCLKINEAIGDQEDIQMTKEKLVELYRAWGKPKEAAKSQSS